MSKHIPGESTSPPLETAGNDTTNSILQQVLDHNQKLMRLLTTANTYTRKHKSSRLRPSSGPHQGQPSANMPDHYNTYNWTHGRGNHHGCDCNAKDTGHKDEATITNKNCGITYGCNE